MRKPDATGEKPSLDVQQRSLYADRFVGSVANVLVARYDISLG